MYLMKLAVFDFDSTLMDGETIDFLADELGIKNEVAAITEEAMSGRLDFFESLTTRVGLLKGLDYKKVVDICKNLPLMPGAIETVNELKSMDYKVICFSGGFRVGTSPAKEILGLHADFSNVLHQYHLHELQVFSLIVQQFHYTCFHLALLELLCIFSLISRL